MEIRNYPGYIGQHSREQYPGAIKNGCRVVKINSEKGDGHHDGTRGTVLGSIGAPEIGVMYFVEWDPRPRFAVGTMALKVKTVDQSESSVFSGAESGHG